MAKLLRRSVTVEQRYHTGRSFIFIHIFFFQKKVLVVSLFLPQEF